MRSIRARLIDERGWGLVSSVLVVGILISLSLPLLSLVDAQQSQSAHERKSESSFNLAEAALDASVFVLGKSWPVANGTYPSECTATTTGSYCPTPALLDGTYTGGDYTNAGWTVQIRDDSGGEYYDPATVPSSPLRWDANKNAKLWVRADAHAADGDRTVVALVRLIEHHEAFPRNAITAGWLSISNNGNKTLFDTKGDAAQPAPVAVRCADPAPSACLDYDPSRDQVSPDTSTPSYTAETAMSNDAIARLRETAESLGTYHTSCPSTLDGDLVFVESGNCSYTGGGHANSATAPGMIVVANGTLSFGGNFTFYGLVYALNLQQSTGIVITLQGAATVVGSVAVDGGGGVKVGSSGDNVVFADGVFPLISSFGGAAPVQGSWRELPPS
jgi:hypothetical protein